VGPARKRKGISPGGGGGKERRPRGRLRVRGQLLLAGPNGPIGLVRFFLFSNFFSNFEIHI
jgi:hypothetical protein